MKYLYENNNNREVRINDDLVIGGNRKVVMAGPCTVSSYSELLATALRLKEMGVDVLRGGVFKPRKSPYDYQGLGEEGLEYLIEVRKIVGIPIVVELTDISYLDMYIDNVDIIQVGAKNMFNYELLKRLGKTNKPILLKRSMSATYEEWLLAAEYILKEGNTNVILCERGIRTFETSTRYTLDLQAIPYIHKFSNLPIIVDPSHAAGNRYMIEDMSRAAIAAGSDGLIIEAELNPDSAICDRNQTIDLDTLDRIVNYSKGNN